MSERHGFSQICIRYSGCEKVGGFNPIIAFNSHAVGDIEKRSTHIPKFCSPWPDIAPLMSINAANTIAKYSETAANDTLDALLIAFDYDAHLKREVRLRAESF